MAWIICLDTSAPRTCVALGRVHAGGSSELLVNDEREDRANQTSERLHLRLQAALEQVGLRPGDLDFIACGCGPGTFTGSRVAVATAKGLALGLSLPVLPLSTLTCLAASAPQPGAPGGAADNTTVLALLDARRSQVYGALYRLEDSGETIEACSEERVIELAELIRELESDSELAPVLARALPLGPGCGPYAEQLPPALRERALLSPGPSAAGLWRAAVSAHRRNEAIDGARLSVNYLRKSYAEMGINPPKRPPYKSPWI